MPHVLLSPRKELMRNAAAAAANVLTDDDLLKLIMENHGLYASRFARVCKQWKRAAEAVKLSGQTLESEPHVSCGGVWSRLDAGNDDHYLHDGGALVGPWATSIVALPSNTLLVSDTNNYRVLLLGPAGKRLREFPTPGDYPVVVASSRGVIYYTSLLRRQQDTVLCRRLRLSDGEELPCLPLPAQYRDYPHRREIDFVVAPNLNRLFMLRYLQPNVDSGSIDVYDLDTLALSFTFGSFSSGGVCLAHSASCPSLFAAFENGPIRVYDPATGTLLRAFGSSGRAPGSFTELTDIAVTANRLFTAEDRGVDFVGRVQVLTLEGVPLQVLPVHTCGGPVAICASAQFVHVLNLVDRLHNRLLNKGVYRDDEREELEDLGHPMHSLVGFKIRARKQ